MEALEKAKLALRQFLLENKEKVRADLEYMRSKSDSMKRHKIELPIYHGFIEVISCKNYNKINKELGLNVDNSSTAFAYRKSPHNYVLCFAVKDDLSIIVHEVVHLVNFIYEDHNIQLSKTNDEPQAYLTQYLFNQIVSKL